MSNYECLAQSIVLDDLFHINIRTKVLSKDTVNTVSRRISQLHENMHKAMRRPGKNHFSSISTESQLFFNRYQSLYTQQTRELVEICIQLGRDCMVYGLL